LPQNEIKRNSGDFSSLKFKIEGWQDPQMTKNDESQELYNMRILNLKENI
jgi:hypothetical protein